MISDRQCVAKNDVSMAAPWFEPRAALTTARSTDRGIASGASMLGNRIAFDNACVSRVVGPSPCRTHLELLATRAHLRLSREGARRRPFDAAVKKPSRFGATA